MNVPTTRVRHDESGAEAVDIPTTLLDHYAARGWVVDVFDPSGHTVKEVLAHLQANPDETEAVMAAEAAGEARVSLIGESSTATRSTSPAPAGATTASSKEGTS